MRLRSGWISPQRTSRCRQRRFPLRRCDVLSPYALPDCHSGPHCNPLSARDRQPGCFPRQMFRLFSLFCSTSFKGRSQSRAPAGAAAALIPYSHRPTQGRLHLHTALRPGIEAMHRIAGSYPVSYTVTGITTTGVRLCTKTGLHENRVGSAMPLADALDPQARLSPRFPPAPARNWA